MYVVGKRRTFFKKISFGVFQTFSVLGINYFTFRSLPLSHSHSPCHPASLPSDRSPMALHTQDTPGEAGETLAMLSDCEPVVTQLPSSEYSAASLSLLPLHNIMIDSKFIRPSSSAGAESRQVGGLWFLEEPFLSSSLSVPVESSQ